MIQNPYAKKRPRPDHFTNENDSIGCDTNAGIATAYPIPKATSKRCPSNESPSQSVDPKGSGASLSSSSSSSSSNGGFQYQTNHVNASHSEQSKRYRPAANVSQRSPQPGHSSHSLQPPHSTMETITNGHVAQDRDVPPTLSQSRIRNPYACRTSSHATASQVRVIPNHSLSSSSAFGNHSVVTLSGVLNQSQSTLSSTRQAPSPTTTTTFHAGTATKVPTVHQPSCSQPTTNYAAPLYRANPYKKKYDSVPSQSNHVPFHTSTAIPRHPPVQGRHSNQAKVHSSYVNASNHQRNPVQHATSFDEATTETSNGQIIPAEPSSPMTCHPPIVPCQRAIASPLVETTLRSAAWQPQKSPSLDRLESCSTIKNDPDPPNALPSACVVECTDPSPTIELTSLPPSRPLTHATYYKPSTSPLKPFQQPTPPRQNIENHDDPVPTQAILNLRAVAGSACTGILSAITNKLQDPSALNPYYKKSVSESNSYAPKNQGITTIPTVTVLGQQAISSASSTSTSRPAQAGSNSNQPTLTVTQCTESKRNGVTSHVVPMINASDTQTACQTRPPLEVTQYPVHSMASIRPDSWAPISAKRDAPVTAKITPLPLATQLQAATQTPKVELPGEDLLPPELQFSPEDVKPISDEYRQRLVASADISKPLLNGWTLFNHQKKVWI
jgi:hypothetical protein